MIGEFPASKAEIAEGLDRFDVVLAWILLPGCR
jgi:hypothetical protein